MRTYHLSIKTNVEDKVTELNNYLYPDEIFINSSFKLTYKITNIGSEKFPGGKIERFGMSSVPGGPYLHWSFTPPLEIPEILKEASVTQSQSLRLLCQPGVFSLVFQISLDKEGKILYYEHPSKESGSDKYTSPLCIAVDRRQVEIVTLLRQILSNLKKE